jgi:hypothetical protein
MVVHNEAKDDFSSVPLLIYVPGLGSRKANSAERVAEVIAESLDRQTQGQSFTTRTSEQAVAPAGLTVGKTVVDGNNKPVLQLLQFDYRPLLEKGSTPAAPDVVPGMFRSATYAVAGVGKLIGALGEKSKRPQTKWQLFMGFLACLTLIFVAVAALYSMLVAMGADLSWGKGFLDLEHKPASVTFGVSSLGLTITWAKLRKGVLAGAGITQRLMRFIKNTDAIADTITTRLDAAVDNLRDNKWDGPIHLLGYSFGSLVIFEAMNPRVTSRIAVGAGGAVSSMVTIGCPLDVVRLYYPDYVAKRVARHPELPWTNVFNQADIFASNLMSRDDKRQGKGNLRGIASFEQPQSKRYLDEKIGFFQIFVAGRPHTSYWEETNGASCFDELAGLWVTATEGVAAPTP